jgi:glycosyltransferase involved in cell wall biosynthesis
MYHGKETFRPGVSVVVPVYNGAEPLEGVVARIETVVSKLTPDCEIVLVNDGSQDLSWEVITRLTMQSHRVRGIQLMRNFGQHNALLCGIRAAIYSTIVTLDDDGQNPPEEIPKLLARLEEGFDLVYGVPISQKHGLWRNLASRLTKLAMQSVLGAPTRHVSAYRAFHTRLRKAFAEYEGSYVAIDVLLGWGAARVSSVAVQHCPRQHGKSNYTPGRLVVHTLNMMTSFGVLPLQLASLVGFCFTIFGGGVLVYVLACYFLEGGAVAGFPFLASIIAIFSGAQLFALGMMGEYLARIHSRSMKKPAYVIAEQTESPPEGALEWRREITHEFKSL